jgi:hypothetical protein
MPKRIPGVRSASWRPVLQPKTIDKKKTVLARSLDLEVVAQREADEKDEGDRKEVL